MHSFQCRKDQMDSSHSKWDISQFLWFWDPILALEFVALKSCIGRFSSFRCPGGLVVGLFYLSSGPVGLFDVLVFVFCFVVSGPRGKIRISDREISISSPRFDSFLSVHRLLAFASACRMLPKSAIPLPQLPPKVIYGWCGGQKT